MVTSHQARQAHLLTNHLLVKGIHTTGTPSQMSSQRRVVVFTGRIKTIRSTPEYSTKRTCHLPVLTAYTVYDVNTFRYLVQ